MTHPARDKLEELAMPKDIIIIADEMVMEMRWENVPTDDFYHASGLIAHALRAERNSCAATLRTLQEENQALRKALEEIADTELAKFLRKLVAGWDGEGQPEEYRFGKHPSQLGATIPSTVGDVYALDETIRHAREVLQSKSTEAGE